VRLFRGLLQARAAARDRREVQSAPAERVARAERRTAEAVRPPLAQQPCFCVARARARAHTLPCMCTPLRSACRPASAWADSGMPTQVAALRLGACYARVHVGLQLNASAAASRHETVRHLPSHSAQAPAHTGAHQGAQWQWRQPAMHCYICYYRRPPRGDARRLARRPMLPGSLRLQCAIPPFASRPDSRI